jgi:chorismate mutase/prephenate dehydratase
MGAEEADLESLRAAIDHCDREIVRLINDRARHAQEIGRRKRQSGQAVYAPDREKAVYEKVMGLNEGPLADHTVHAIYREIMSGTIALEGATRIAYLGPAGTWTHTAALQKFGSSMEYVPYREIRDVFLAVSRGHVDYGVVPIENSTEGSVNQTCDMFMECDLRICSEILVEIHHNLLATCELHEVGRIVSHPQALAQCRNWLAANAARIDVVEAPSTTRAAELAARERGTAAIAAEAAAALYDLHILESCIEDRPDNVTRFAVIAHAFGKATGSDRTSIMFSLAHEAGSLADALLIFKNRGVNLTRIESRPARKRTWEYAFFIDLDGHIDEPRVQEALADLRAASHDLAVLGSYPQAQRHTPASHVPANEEAQ